MSITSPSVAIPLVLTDAGRRWLEARLERTADRLADLVDELQVERTDELVTEHAQLLAQVEELTSVLRDARAPRDIADDPSVVELGDAVAVEFPDGTTEELLVVHPLEAGLDERRTAADAPLARAVLGAAPGDRVTVVAPAGVYHAVVRGRRRIDD